MTRSTEPGPADTNLHCPECDYNLTGAVRGRCPWCGWVIDERLLSTIELDRSNARRIGAIVACLVCGVGAMVAVAALVRHGFDLSLRDGLATVGVLIAAIGHVGLAGLLAAPGTRWPIYRRDAGHLFQFAGWFSIVLGVIGATELLRSREVLGIPVAATLEFALAALFYALPGSTLLVMRMVSFRDPRELTAPRALRRVEAERFTGRIPYVVEVTGRFAEGDLLSSWTDDTRPTTPAVDMAVEQAWSATLAPAQSDDRALFDGSLVRLLSAKVQGPALHLTLGPTTYRAFVGTNMNPAIVNDRECQRYLANPLGISASVITRDGFIAYGRRSPRVVFHAGCVHPFGGLIDRTDRRGDGSVEVFGAMLRELEEELDLTRADVTEIVAIALVRDRRIQQPELIFEVSVRCSRSELESRFDPARSDGEHSGIEFLYDDPEAALPSLNRIEPTTTPVLEAAYLLHGCTTWGPAWYEQVCLLRYGEMPGRMQPNL